MVSIPGVPPVVMWGGFIILILFFLFIDLGLFNRKRHTPSVKEALIWTFVWFSLAMLFNLFIWWEFGSGVALEFFTGYLIEKSLSLDNLFVILLIFTSFQINPKYQHKILFWGIIGALVMRGLMIGLGSALVLRFHWILYIFGALLIYSGVKIFLAKEEKYDPHKSFVVRYINKIVRVTRKDYGDKLIVKEKGYLTVTILFVALLVVEVTDVVFAFDSIPAIFGITLDPFIVFTSNIFAILGLRSLYFVIMHAHRYFSYLSIGLGIILIFIGLKMLAESFIEIPIMVSLGVVAAILIIYILASIFLLPKSYRRKIQREKQKKKAEGYDGKTQSG